MCLGRLWGEWRGRGAGVSGKQWGSGGQFLLFLPCHAEAGLHCQAGLLTGDKIVPVL